MRLSGEQVLLRVPGCVLSHEEAARRLSLALLEDGGRCRLTVPRTWSHVDVPGWEVVRRDVRPEERVLLSGGAEVTAAARTVVDLAAELSLDGAVVLADSALRARLVTAAVLVDILTARRGPSPNRRRVVAELLDPWAGSVLESLLRVLLLTSGLPAPRPQYLVVDGLEVVGRVDFAWPERRLIVEADGFAFHSDREAYRRDRARMNELERLGWRVLRFTYEDVVSRPGYVVGLVRACLALAA